MPLNILVTGATGYIGGRLVPRLLDLGHHVRCLARDPSRLQGRSWSTAVDTVQADLLDPASLSEAFSGVEMAYYLVHSLAGGHDFHRLDLQAAKNFAVAAAASGVRRIIYLGALGDPATALSVHLRSRQETADALRSTGIPVTEFRAGVIVGSGSLSFEMIRYLCERVPVMICPRWVFTKTQPIAVRDVLEYLVEALAIEQSYGKTIEIGGADVLTYGEMMSIYARVRNFTRLMLPVPLLTPRLSSYWVHLVTPIPAAIARPLIEGLRNEVTVHGTLARDLFPLIRPIDYRTAVRLALEKLETGAVETAWTDSMVSSQGGGSPVTLQNIEGMIIEKRTTVVKADPERIYRAFTSLGGETGWLCCNWAWKLRGMADRLLGGVGMRRGRRHPQLLRAGEALDFWRVESVEENRSLRLRAEMKVPGRAWLQFETVTIDAETSRLSQTALFAPKGLPGFLYWYMLYPMHALIFSGLIKAIAARAQARKP